MIRLLLGIIGALAVFALPAHTWATNYPETRPIPLESRAGGIRTVAALPPQTLSGVLIHQSQTLPEWYLYPGACSGPITPRSHPPAWAEDLEMYAVGTTGSYTTEYRNPVGDSWLIAGNTLPTPDTCTPNSNRIFAGGDGLHPVPDQNSSIVSCTIPIPAGAGSVVAMWDEYLDLPPLQGYVQYTEFRVLKGGSWGSWMNTSPGGSVRTGGLRAWVRDGDELAAAAQADEVQIRYTMQCVPFFADDHQNCADDVLYGVLYDNFRLAITTGVPLPVFGVHLGSIAQSMFVDGTIPGLNCSPATLAAGQCWPGIRGSDLPGTGESNVHDNFNSPLGDSITIAIATALRTNGKGVNWHHGFGTVNRGLTIEHTNPDYNAAFDKPRVIFRMFDPATKTWSPFDSSELDADKVVIAGGDTSLVESKFRMNWPPRDKIGTSLPGGFTINGRSLYSQLAFLPHGARIQYYWKGVDVNGSTTWQFSSDALAREVADLPTLPGSSIIAPDIIEFDVLPGVYSTAGAAGTLVAGRTNTPLLDLDGSYTRWNYPAHATVQALRALKVRADRYRTLQGLEQGGHIGGREFDGTRVGRPSNYFPNMDEYGIKDSLAIWYRLMIESSHTSTSAIDEESDAKLIKGWWETSTGPDGGDRCIFASGDDYFSSLLAGEPNQIALATSVFGVAAVANQWTCSPQPFVSDMFADPASGPSLGVPGAYKYSVDGDCPRPNRFDALTKVGSAEAQNSALYPICMGVTHVAGVAYMTERDALSDHDQNKALGYGFSIQLIGPKGAPDLSTRTQVLYRFLTSCRGPRSTAATCWPCPADANKFGNWATLTGFDIPNYGPLYAMQNGNLVATGVEEPGPEAPRFTNSLFQNSPNPFNPETIVPYSLATRGKVTIRIYDIAGRCIRVLVDAVKDPGTYQARWTGKLDSGGMAASSIYFYRITYPDGTTSARKMTILR